MTNLRPDALDRLGFDAETLSARFPRLVYASVTGYGRTGPERAVASPVEFLGAPTDPTRPVPQLGEHTEAALREAGFDDARRWRAYVLRVPSAAERLVDRQGRSRSLGRAPSSSSSRQSGKRK